ncbi:hypothetical protein E2C01_062593 [Portunus trituberculatus]|uniref:Uncharacterized protein n=1 Tax=Portunus trituberculatus TaxID=210409 RepID=A0A5B7HE38_PORTR|nr:hypothetical protein [Portunus trituberculatus]
MDKVLIRQSLHFNTTTSIVYSPSATTTTTTITTTTVVPHPLQKRCLTEDPRNSLSFGVALIRERHETDQSFRFALEFLSLKRVQ